MESGHSARNLRTVPARRLQELGAPAFQRRNLALSGVGRTPVVPGARHWLMAEASGTGVPKLVEFLK